MTQRTTARMAWALGLLAPLMAAVGLAIALSDPAGADEVHDTIIVLLVIAVPYALVGALVASRRPDNPLGWLFLAIGLLQALNVSAAAYGHYGLLWHPGSLPGATTAHVLMVWPWFPALALIATVIPLLFPTGRPLSPRWRWLVRIELALLVLQAVGWMADVWPVRGLENPERPGNLLEGGNTPFGFLVMVAFPATGLVALPSLASVLIRFRRSQGDERQQMKWIAYALTLVIMALFATFLAPESWPAWTEDVFISTLALLPVAMGVAILKYRLYDIDVVISKTVVFAGLAGFITAVYVAIVVGVGSLLGAGGEPNLGLSIVATAVVAVAFQPARERLTRLANRLVYGRRATPYEVLSRFSAQVGETVATDETLEHMARLLAEGTGAARAQVWLKVGEQMRSAASWPAEAVPDYMPVVNADGSLPEFAEVDLAVPISHDGQLLGALTVTKKRGEPITPTERSLIEDLAAQAGLVLRNVVLTADLRARLEELRDSRRRLVEAQDNERRRLERDLHDGAQQQLVALKIKLGLAKRLAERDGAAPAAALVDQLTAETDEAVASLRELAHGIYPPLLAAEGLAGALQARAARAPIPATVEADGVGRYSQEVEAAIYFCVLEAIQNAVKYASASQITVRLAHSDGQLTFQVADDGVGFDPTTTPRGHGLSNMADRLDALGGNLEIQSAPSGGVRLVGRLPVSITAAVL